ncbi:MAG: class I SAM-dependent methyltransferase, partial [Kiloniellales bacterium]|nr:class I SAM-dependent methyltransferase [Kiloniellales bacterium]
MSDRSDKIEDYITDTIFPSGYIGYQQPALLSFVAAGNGFLPPDPARPFTYLELGCGSGVTLNPLAAANPGSSFIGVDFNERHWEIARADAKAGSLSNVSYINASFEKMGPNDLPECDYIAIHGAFSWLAPAALSAVFRILRERLKPGGLFYVDYLSAPERLPVEPLWYLLRQVTEGSHASSETRAAEGMEILRRLSGAGAGYLTQNPRAHNILKKHLERVDGKNANALSHLAHHAL